MFLIFVSELSLYGCNYFKVRSVILGWITPVTVLHIVQALPLT